MSAQSNGLVAAAKQNEAGGATPATFSLFPLSYSFYNTERFGEYTPCFVQEGISTDTLPLNSTHEVRSYTLQAPLMQSLLKKKDYFYVPMEAILPLNWEKFYTNPVIGEDVPVDVGCGVAEFWNQVENLFISSWQKIYDDGDSVDSSAESVASWFSDAFRFAVFFEYFYSTGSLMSTLGISGNSFCHLSVSSQAFDSSEDSYRIAPYDTFFDLLCSLFKKYVKAFRCNLGYGENGSPKSYYVGVNIDPSNYGVVTGTWITFREFLDLLRDDLSLFEISVMSLISGSTIASFANDVSDFVTFFSWKRVLNDSFGVAIDSDHKIPLNTARLWAYQLVCAHFYSNDHVDFVYSAQLFRQYIQNLILAVNDGELYQNFSVNGFYYNYDPLSAYYTASLGFAKSSFFSLGTPNVAYWTALLHFKRSLRYMDYFTGARSRPLAVGDSSVDVADNKVDVLDLSRGRMMAKFLQAVNRAGRKFGSYMQELFHKVPAPDYHNPFYLAHTSDVVGTNENQNTADGQRAANAITSNMMANASRYMFEFHPDRDCIVIGISYYDIPRVYVRAIERQNFFVDRFDMFNPYMQNIGDQSIYKAEIGTDDPSLAPFGYQNRHMEYKQRFNQAAGGFANPDTGLDNWIFVADALRRSQVVNIDSSFIRSFNSELDHFFTALTGYSNGSYFHFICRYDNRQDASRPMAYAPVIA